MRLVEYRWFPAMSNLHLENLCDICLRKQCVKIGIRLNNCCWGQVVTGTWTLLLRILGLCDTKDINFIFFSPEIFSSSIFTSERGLILCTHQSVWKKCAAVEIYVIPCYERLVKIWNLAIFFTRKSLMCVYESICVKIGIYRIALKAKR